MIYHQLKAEDGVTLRSVCVCVCASLRQVHLYSELVYGQFLCVFVRAHV